jgi:hypothetical protein
MATDAQESGPLPGQKFTLARWSQIFGANTGIVGDTNGSAFGLTLPPTTDVAEVGSPSIESVAIVGGFPLIIPAGETQSVTIPASTNASIGRTDIIAARFETGYSTPPGPVRLIRIAGTEGSASFPSYDAAMPSPMTLPLWAVTRKQGQSLNQATAVDLRIRSAWTTVVPAGGIMPPSAPLGMRATRGGITYRRDMVGSTVDWVREWSPPNASGETVFDTGWVLLDMLPGWEHVPGRNARVRRVGTQVGFRGAVRTISGNPASGTHTPVRVPGGIGCRPTAMSRYSSMTFAVGASKPARIELDTDGYITFSDLPGTSETARVDTCGFTTD